MRFKKTLVWSCITGQPHPSLDKKEQTIEGLIPLVEALFPSVNYYSITGFGQVMKGCVIPTLKKLFPELQSLSAEDIKEGENVEVAQFLPSKGYEWQESSKWQAKFNKLLVAA
ncbi:MAG: hypothetical protein Q8O98_02585 [bacterium]|nr:hypothetical protein [bacterium]